MRGLKNLLRDVFCVCDMKKRILQNARRKFKKIKLRILPGFNIVHSIQKKLHTYYDELMTLGFANIPTEMPI